MQAEEMRGMTSKGGERRLRWTRTDVGRRPTSIGSALVRHSTLGLWAARRTAGDWGAQPGTSLYRLTRGRPALPTSRLGPLRGKQTREQPPSNGSASPPIRQCGPVAAVVGPHAVAGRALAALYQHQMPLTTQRMAGHANCWSPGRGGQRVPRACVSKVKASRFKS